MVNRNISIISKFFHTGVSPGTQSLFRFKPFLISISSETGIKKEKISMKKDYQKSDALISEDVHSERI